jgi:prepilin-type N-terminal cleavage/methylation domain-containing protein
MAGKLRRSFLVGLAGLLGSACSADFSRKHKGFTLLEVLCAIVVLSFAILAAFAAIAYALTVTSESRGRMDAFAEIERAAVTSVALRAANAEGKVSMTLKEIDVPLTIKSSSQTTRTIGLTALTYKESADAGVRRYMQSPVVTVFINR